MKEVCIIAIEYLEPEYQETKAQLEEISNQYGVPIFYVERTPEGWGSLAEAINYPFKYLNIAKRFDFAWIVTNVRFPEFTFKKLLEAIRETRYAAIHPAFNSDHAHLQIREDHNGMEEVPFVEFTAPMVRTDIMAKFALDDLMPYWGHDIDWGHRVRAAGHKIGVHHGTMIDHTYIRHNRSAHPITAKRHAKRKATDRQTTRQLIKKYGSQWRIKLKR